MKKLFTLTFFISFMFFANAQSEGLSYQAVIISPDDLELPGVNSEGNYLPNTTIALRFSILFSTNPLETPEFEEVRIVDTDEFGRINLIIGEDNDDFKAIEWDGTTKFLKVEIDFEGGSNFEEISRERLTYAPYALHRKIKATDSLTVEGHTLLYGHLDVELPTNLNSSLDVNNGNATNLSGTLTVDEETNLNSNFNVNLNSPSYLTGDLTVDGNTALNGLLDVIGHTTLGDLTVNGQASFGDLVADDLIVNLSTTLNGQTIIDGMGQQVTIQSNMTTFEGGYARWYNHPLLIDGGINGLAIRVSESRSNNTNFITFYDTERDAPWGRIEGEIPSQFTNNADYNLDKSLLAYDKFSGIIDSAFALNDILVATGNLIAANSSSTGCAGIGACVTVPILSWIISAGAQLVIAIAQEVFVVIYTVRAFENEATFDQNKLDFQGVTYASGAGDYAEYLKKRNIDDDFVFGDIVGVYGGTISKNTTTMDKAMVVSRKPIVLGAIPEEGTEQNYAKIAFMGQVPVKVFGKVNIGDYIIPSGNNDGIGKAIHPSKISSENVKKIVGIAWEASQNEYSINRINVAVGLNTNDNNPIIEKLQSNLDSQELKIENLESQIDEISDLLKKLVNGEKEDYDNIVLSHNDNDDRYEVVNNGESDIIYFKITDEHMEQSFEEAKRLLKANGTLEQNKLFFEKLEKEPYFKQMIIDKMKEKIQSGFHFHKQIDTHGKH